MSNTWICDTCGQTIKSVEDGWVEWLADKSDDRRRNYGLRLVHHVTAIQRRSTYHGCQYDGNAEYERSQSIVGDMPLDNYVGPDGLMDLLAFLYDKDFKDDTEVLEMIKRLHVPGYEHAFRHFDAAIAAGVFEPNTAPGYYSQRDIKAVLEWLKDKDRSC